MSINEIFPFSTVKKVIFQIRYPNLFFIESKIGDYQLRIMDKFPESSLLFQKQLLFANIGPDFDIDKLKNKDDSDLSKIWHFNNNKGFQLNVKSDSLDITSEYHKSYAIEGADDKFRDIINLSIKPFLELTGLPSINRIGFRYIDECPLPKKDNDTILKYYNTSFPITRFNLETASEMSFRTVIQRDGCGLIYSESIKRIDDAYKLILDFDGFAENIKSSEYLDITDKLHDLICREFKETLKEPVFNYMRTGELT